jgi:hypothetical protein
MELPGRRRFGGFFFALNSPDGLDGYAVTYLRRVPAVEIAPTTESSVWQNHHFGSWREFE